MFIQSNSRILLFFYIHPNLIINLLLFDNMSLRFILLNIAVSRDLLGEHSKQPPTPFLIKLKEQKFLILMLILGLVRLSIGKICPAGLENKFIHMHYLKIGERKTTYTFYLFLGGEGLF